MRVVVLMETSNRVAGAFRARGHEVYSVDLLPNEIQPAWHLIADVRDVLRARLGYAPPNIYPAWVYQPWDLVIAHPSCTYLCNSGVRWLTTIPKIQKPGVVYGEARRAAMIDAAELFADLLMLHTQGVPRVAVENPVMHKHARAALSAALIKRDSCGAIFDQSIQPWQFGEPAVKRTCLWLRGLPALRIDPAEVLHPPKRGEVGYSEWRACHHASPGPDRWKERSRTYAGVAAAMADQWGRE